MPADGVRFACHRTDEGYVREQLASGDDELATLLEEDVLRVAAAGGRRGW